MSSLGRITHALRKYWEYIPFLFKLVIILAPAWRTHCL